MSRARLTLTALTALTLAGGALAIPAGAASAASLSRQQVSDHWTSTTPGTPTGRHYAVDFRNPATPGGKPPAVEHVHLQLPAGARFNTAAVPECTASDAQLMLEGAAACPAGSRMGTMKLTFDTGLAGQLQFLHATVTFLDAREQLIFLSQDDSSGERLVSRATITASTLDSELPPLPGTPPDGAADLQERATFLAASGTHGPYLRTPPTCPANHRWVEHETYTYRDGLSQTVAVSEPCIPLRRRGARRKGHPGSRRTRSRRRASPTRPDRRGEAPGDS